LYDCSFKAANIVKKPHKNQSDKKIFFIFTFFHIKRRTFLSTKGWTNRCKANNLRNRLACCECGI